MVKKEKKKKKEEREKFSGRPKIRVFASLYLRNVSRSAHFTTTTTVLLLASF